MRYLLPGRAAWAVSLTRTIVALVTLFSVATQLAALSVQPSTATFSLDTTTLTIPQVDYEPAIYYRDGDPYPHLNFERVDRRRTVRKDHTAVVMENRYVKLTLLPEMGRVYSFVYKPTGHETLWQNDLVTVGGAANDTGWWLWIGVSSTRSRATNTARPGRCRGAGRSSKIPLGGRRSACGFVSRVPDLRNR